RRGEVDVAHALAADLRARDLHAAALAHDALVADALVLAAVALPVLRGTEDALAEEPVLLGLERPVVDGLGLRHLAARPRADLLRGGEPNGNGVEIVDVDQVGFSAPLRSKFIGSAVRSRQTAGLGLGSAVCRLPTHSGLFLLDVLIQLLFRGLVRLTAF